MVGSLLQPHHSDLHINLLFYGPFLLLDVARRRDSSHSDPVPVLASDPDPLRRLILSSYLSSKIEDLQPLLLFRVF